MAPQLPLNDRTTRPRTARRAGAATARRPRALAVVPGRPDQLVEVAGADWRLDDATRRAGIAGVAAARRALADALAHSAA